MPHGILTHEEVLGRNALLQLHVLTRIDPIQRRADHTDCPTPGVEGGHVHRRVDASRAKPLTITTPCRASTFASR